MGSTEGTHSGLKCSDQDPNSVRDLEHRSQGEPKRYKCELRGVNVTILMMGSKQVVLFMHATKSLHEYL